MPDANDADVVVFDFDLTLTQWETASRFFKGLLRRAPWRLSIYAASRMPCSHGRRYWIGGSDARTAAGAAC